MKKYKEIQRNMKYEEKYVKIHKSTKKYEEIQRNLKKLKNYEDIRRNKKKYVEICEKPFYMKFPFRLCSVLGCICNQVAFGIRLCL